jgi:PcfJ-like protein
LEKLLIIGRVRYLA